MKKVVIAEDEKIIRHGIKVMIKRSGVPIEEIIECKNGEEARKIIFNDNIDVLFTDVRMPKVDGITLVKSITNRLGQKAPKIVVISGYDDFSYAVEFLRNGAKEYLLKPIKRDDISRVMHKLEDELKKEEKERGEIQKAVNISVKFALMQRELDEYEFELLKKNIEGKMNESTSYVVICTNFFSNNEKLWDNVSFFADVNGHNVIIMRPERVEKFANENFKNFGFGVSSIHDDLNDIQYALKEAMRNRIRDFYKLKPQYNKNLLYQINEVSEDEIERMVQQIGTHREDEAESEFHNYVNKTRECLMSPKAFKKMGIMLIGRIEKYYKDVLKTGIVCTKPLYNIYSYTNVEQYEEAMFSVMRFINSKMCIECENWKIKCQMENAVKYIEKNYNKNINMAMVSNEVSMNYSVFSMEFKKYTGKNFVRYLKDVRMKKAAKLLCESEYKVNEIANMVGYPNVKHFLKSFKKTYGVTPTEYRRTSITQDNYNT